MTERRFVAGFISLVFCASALTNVPALAKKDWTESPLGPDLYRQVERAKRQMKSGKFQQATASINEMLASANDVPKCLEIAASTESYGSPMIEARRACLNRAYQLCQNNEDMLLVALKARHYQMFEVTRQAITYLLGHAKNVKELYDLARRCQEVALNDVAHMAMEKAYASIPDDAPPEAAYQYAEQAKALGMNDLVAKVVKQLLDNPDETPESICDTLLKCQGYKMRDLNRYGLRRALDLAKNVPDMEAIYEAARQLNEPDVANRAQYYVRRGKIIMKIKEDRAAYEAQLRAWREGIDIDLARQQAGLGQDPTLPSSGQRSNRPPTSGF